LGKSGPHFELINWATAFISAATALYLIPLVPNLMGTFEKNLTDLELKEKIEESHRKLMTFMAFLCHEIRNPLFAITSTIDFMEDYQLTEEQERSLTNIKQSTNLMLRLVNDVLDLSRLESGKFELEEINFDVREMMQNLAAITETQIRVKHHDAVEFRFHLDASVPRIVCSDSCRILQVSNLKVCFLLIKNEVSTDSCLAIDCIQFALECN
jgi:signal transduction histidine kinase